MRRVPMFTLLFPLAGLAVVACDGTGGLFSGNSAANSRTTGGDDTGCSEDEEQEGEFEGEYGCDDDDEDSDGDSDSDDDEDDDDDDD